MLRRTRPGLVGRRLLELYARHWQDHLLELEAAATRLGLREPGRLFELSYEALCARPGDASAPPPGAGAHPLGLDDLIVSATARRSRAAIARRAPCPARRTPRRDPGHDVVANPLDDFELAMKPKVETLMIDRMDQNQEIVNRYLNDDAFQAAAFKAIVKRVYDGIRKGARTRPPKNP